MMPGGASLPLRSPRSRRETSEPACRPLPTDADFLAHDLWNILSSVRGYAQLLLSMVDDERTVAYLAIIEAESSRCCGLIERMLRPADLMSEEPASESDVARATERACGPARGEAAHLRHRATSGSVASAEEAALNSCEVEGSPAPRRRESGRSATGSAAGWSP